MSIHYCFIARDTDMIVFETVLTKDLKSTYKRDLKEKLTDLDQS